MISEKELAKILKGYDIPTANYIFWQYKDIAILMIYVDTEAITDGSYNDLMAHLKLRYGDTLQAQLSDVRTKAIMDMVKHMERQYDL